MTPDQLEQLKTDEVLRKRLAKLMALRCFRNTRLEDFHSGRVPSSVAGDYSDVKVVTPLGEIPWRDVSRLSDPEMRELMIDVVDHCYDFLMEVCSPHGEDIVDDLTQRDELSGWNDPELRVFRS